jgi:hypothetical protein
MKRFAWLAGYAVACFLAFPHPIGGRVLDLGLGLAWVAPAALLLGLDGLGVRRAAWLAFLAWLAAHSAILHWIYIVTVQYARPPHQRARARLHGAPERLSARERRSQAGVVAFAVLLGPRSTTCARSRSRASPGRRSAMRSTRTRCCCRSPRSVGCMRSPS